MSYSTIYRREHPEYRETEKEKDRERASKKYNENPEYREHKKRIALERYYKLKEQKNASISVK